MDANARDNFRRGLFSLAGADTNSGLDVCHSKLQHNIFDYYDRPGLVEVTKNLQKLPVHTRKTWPFQLNGRVQLFGEKFEWLV